VIRPIVGVRLAQVPGGAPKMAAAAVPTTAALQRGVISSYTEYAENPDPACAAGFLTWGYDTLPAHAVEGVDASVASGGGCPLAHCAVAKGSSVIDLGCGPGIDVVVAARLVGAAGRVAGVDLTPAMLARAKTAAGIAEVSERVTFHHARIDDPSAVPPIQPADLVMSNGVFNLCTDKPAAFATAFALTKPGGTFVLADVCKEPPQSKSMPSSAADPTC